MWLDESNLGQALEALAATSLLLLPKNVDGITKFAPYFLEGDIALSAVNTLIPPKTALFPATEKLYGYKDDGLGLIEDGQVQEQILFGIRPCDVYGISCLDKVFLEQGFEDSYYKRKRSATTLIAITCTQPGATCFCDSMGLDSRRVLGADMELRPAEGGWQVFANSQAGREVLNLWRDFLRKDKVGKGDDGFDEGKSHGCPLSVNLAGLGEKLPLLFEHKLWQDFAQPCLSCGICAFLCPTCHCFDISAESRGQQGAQYRIWDSCMFPEYTAMAGGHNLRPEAAQRLRNRFMHKLSYFQQRYGQTMCTGCGRCLMKCPAHIYITDFIAAAGEVEI